MAGIGAGPGVVSAFADSQGSPRWVFGGGTLCGACRRAPAGIFKGRQGSATNVARWEGLMETHSLGSGDAVKGEHMPASAHGDPREEGRFALCPGRGAGGEIRKEPEKPTQGKGLVQG